MRHSSPGYLHANYGHISSLDQNFRLKTKNPRCPIFGRGDLERRGFQSQELHFPLPKGCRINSRVPCLKPITEFQIFLKSHNIGYSTTCAGQAMCSNLVFASKFPSLSIFQISDSQQGQINWLSNDPFLLAKKKKKRRPLSFPAKP